MEFYTGRRFGTGDPFVVSIPNGMEFYLVWVGVGVVYGSFNSQRDGILQALVVLYLYARLRFNSQRDGILPITLPLLRFC